MGNHRNRIQSTDGALHLICDSVESTARKGNRGPVLSDDSPASAQSLDVQPDFGSMVLSMVIAGIFGAAIPLMLTAARQDPAQASSIILTTVTDVTGSLSFLGIATLFAGFL